MQRLAPSLVTLRARPPGCPAWTVAPVPSTLARSLRSRPPDRARRQGRPTICGASFLRGLYARRAVPL